ncbi:hypothetical protein BDV98DRAFT_329938 [Pterulicium gracile]|uniref:Uncharacterized protein n=1 Tax=Pterulicium gracile TaxID=1884261 RepID=A0A5C3QTJ2_9AGAR|nr:hypothetical protein BDV98DRAFT_329938 [Pterula gracilis]
MEPLRRSTTYVAFLFFLFSYFTSELTLLCFVSILSYNKPAAHPISPSPTFRFLLFVLRHLLPVTITTTTELPFDFTLFTTNGSYAPQDAEPGAEEAPLRRGYGPISTMLPRPGRRGVDLPTHTIIIPFVRPETIPLPRIPHYHFGPRDLEH